MASEGSGGGKPFWSDYEVTVDRDGIPHYTGASPALMKEYTRRVKFAFHGLEGEGKDEEAEAADLLKKQMRFGRRLIDALHGEAWRAVEHLVMQPEKLKKKDGYEEVLNALGSIEKEGVIRKTEAFDKFFESTRRARGEAIDAYLRRKNQAWRDLCDLDETSAMSKDLLSYFVLKGCNLSREDRRSILLANKSTYDQAGIEQSLRVSFHDLHEREKQSGWRDDRKKPMKKRYYANEVHDGESPNEDDVMMVYYHNDSEYDEEDLAEEAFYHGEDDDAEAYELGSDAGASGDDDVYQAYVTMDKGRQAYKDARKKLRDVQKSRGFYQNGNWNSRDQAKEKEKSRSRCAACGHIGHWAGDSVCPKSSAGVGPKKGKGRGKSQSKGKKKSKGGAYAAAPCPMLFSLDDPDDGFQDEEGHSFMVHTGPNDDANANDMQQDEGHTFTDDRRKVSAGSYSADWETVTEPPMPGSDRPAGSRPFEVWAPDGPWESSTTQGRFVEETQEVIKPTMLAKIEVREVSSFAEVRPSNMEQMKAYQLQGLCEKWGIQTGGAKKDLLTRLEDLFAGREVPKKKCTVQSSWWRKSHRLMDLWLDLHRRHHFVLNLADHGRVPNEAIMELLSRLGCHRCQKVGRIDRRQWALRLRRLGRRQKHQGCAQFWRRIWRLASLCMACSVVTAVRLWLQDRLEEMAAFSSRVLNGRTRDAASPDRCKMGWTSSMAESLMSATREALLAAWRATEKSRKLLAVSAFCAYMTAEGNSTEHEPCELLHADHDGSTFEMVAKTHHELEDSNGGGEGRMALVDTACTSCMHSKAWRIAYSKTLPEGYQCEKTERTKLFHFADGSNTGSTIHLWRIPLFMGDRPGEVFSAEVETGTTPLLLSIPALIALDAVIHMREKRINLRSLGVELPLRETRTKHLAMMVSYNPRLGIAKDVEGSPKATSINQDLFVYYSEEASLPVLTDEPMVEVPVSEDYTVNCSPPQFGARGIRKDDVTGFLGDRRSAELAYAMKSMRLQDEKTWAALSKHYSLAEQAATKGFSTTVLFEPFGGHFGVTRTASREFNWTNSQPLDLLDGYDL